MKKRYSVKLTDAIRNFGIVLIIAMFALLSIPTLGFLGATAAAGKTAAAEDVESMTAPARNAGRSVEVTINYFRPDEKYTGWNVWLWANGAEGSQIDFTADATFTITKTKKWKTVKTTLSNVPEDEKNAIGFIIRLNAWEQKDINDDRFISSAKIVDNKVTIFVVSEDAEFYYDEADIVLGAKITSAKFISFNKVRVSTAAPIDKSSFFVIRDEDENVLASLSADTTGVRSARSFTIDLSDTIDISKTYTIYDEPTEEFNPEKNFLKHVITISDLYGLKTFKDMYDYSGALGAEYSQAETTFRVWSPAAKSIALKIYTTGDETETVTPQPMILGDKGVWALTVSGDLDGKYYTYLINGDREIVDPYATSAGRNGKRGMIIKPGSADPDGWATHTRPGKRNSYSDVVIYEAHLRDLTINENSNVPAAKRGKYLGLTVKSEDVDGALTPLSYIKELGVTEVHFQPLFDFSSVDESFAVSTYTSTGENKEFNWGYDPLNYNVPEGSYSSNPADGKVRVNEMKQMIMALHEAGIRVILDVVYNHVSSAAGSNFQALMPGYYFRTDSNGAFTNGSGCGNETASERYMYRKFMIDSVTHWATEYKVDGFRFDLMGLHDVDTMNQIYDTLQTLDADHDIMVYGEPWDAGSNAMPNYVTPANMANARKMPNIAIFNDITRDSLKGSVWDARGTGFVSGLANSDNAIYIGAAGGTKVNGVNYKQFGKDPFAMSPTQNINYASAHDNETLWDRLNGSVHADKETLKAMNRLSAAAVLTSQGPAFFLAGEEMLRTKKANKADNTTYGYDGNITMYYADRNYYYSRNSYKSPDSVNAIDWSLVEENRDMVDFYKGLIAVRKALPELRLSNKGDISQGLTIRDTNLKDGVTSYSIKDPASDNYTVVLFNNNDSSRTVLVPEGNYKVYVDGSQVSADGVKDFSGNKYTVGARSAVVMRAEFKDGEVKTWADTPDEVETEANLGLALGLGIGLPVVALIAGGVLFFLSRKKNKGGDAPNSDAETPAEATEAKADAAEPAEAEEAEAAEKDEASSGDETAAADDNAQPEETAEAEEAEAADAAQSEEPAEAADEEAPAKDNAPSDGESAENGTAATDDNAQPEEPVAKTTKKRSAQKKK